MGTGAQARGVTGQGGTYYRHAPCCTGACLSPRPDPLDPDFAPSDMAGTRAPSLWPNSTRAADGLSTTFAATAFDPLHGQREQQAALALTALDVCSSALALRVLLAVQAVLAVGVLLVARSASDWLALAAAAGFTGLCATLLWLAAVCTFKKQLAAQDGPARGGVLLALGAAAALLAWAPLWAMGLVQAPGPWQWAGVPLAGAGLAGLAGGWLELRARLWQPSDARVRLAELQSRIRPHFLFNALNTAIALVRINPAQAESLLEDLAELFRVALSEGGASVSLDEEIALAQRYLAIEQLRYGARLKISWDIDAKAGAARLPPLVLQPLVENAVRHGVEPSASGAQLWVQASARRGQAVLLVTNTVPAESANPGMGLALANVAERLRLLHDVAGQLDVWREGELYRARIVVPL